MSQREDQIDHTADAEALAETVARAKEKAAKSAESAESAEPEEGAPKGGRSRKAVLAVVGVGVVGLLAGGGAGFAIGHHHSGGGDSVTGSGASLSLPSTLSGGLKRSTSIDSQIKASVTSARTALGAGTDMALYTKGKSDQVLVEATRLPGSALLQAGMTYAKVGADVCATTTSTSGAEAICSRSGADLTVRVTATSSDAAAKYVDELYAALS